MFFNGHLIIGYVHDLENEQYLFQLTGGEECPVTREEFVTHWQAYRKFEEDRAKASPYAERYRPLPVTMEVRRSVRLFPINPSLRRKRKSA